MDVLNRQSHLNEPVKDLVLGVYHLKAEDTRLTLALLFLVCYPRVQISAVSVVHHDAQAALVHERLFVSDDVRVPHRLENVDLHSLLATALPR